MHKELKKDFQEIAAFNFPTKAFLRGASTTKEYRREQFDQYVQLLVKIIQSNPKKEVRVGQRRGEEFAAICFTLLTHPLLAAQAPKGFSFEHG
jgi:hypothetical protein